MSDLESDDRDGGAGVASLPPGTPSPECRSLLGFSRRAFIQHVGAAAGAVIAAPAILRPAVAAPAIASPAVAARVDGEVVISRIPGLVYLPSYVMEKNRLVEKHAARLGLSGLAVRWSNFTAGDTQRAALMSGHCDIILSGLVPMLRLWDQTKGDVKGILASGGMPLSLVTIDPRLQSLADITPEDRIAVPVKQFSTQAVLLQMAASQLHGPEAWGRFDDNCVAMGHAVAFSMLRNRNSAIRSHFSVPPYQFYELRRIRGARVIATSASILGGVHSNTHFYTTTRFAQRHAIVIEALRAAALDAKAMIEKNTQEAVANYRSLSGDKSEAADILEALAEPGMMNWHIEPTGTLAFAQHLHRVGAITQNPESWRDYYLPESHDLAGS